MPSDTLFHSRDLAFLSLPAGVYASPSLHAHNGVLTWFWLASPLTLSWAEGIAARHADKLSADTLHALDVLRVYVYSHYGITDDDTSALLPPGGKLPMDALADSVGLCDMYLFPAWPGIDLYAKSIGYKDALRQDVFEPEAYREQQKKREWLDEKVKKEKARKRKI